MHRIDFMAVFFSLICCLAPGCGDEGGEGTPSDGQQWESYIRADGTMTDGTPIAFHRPATGQIFETGVGVSAVDVTKPFGIGINYSKDFLTAPGTYSLKDEGLEDLSMYIVREHPTDPMKVRMSSVSEGSITFTKVGIKAGDVVEGTFENVRLVRDNEEEQVDIKLTTGEFKVTLD